MKASIIIPAYDEEATLAGVLEATLAVDLPANVEVVVSDDGSSDRTVDIAREYAKRDGRLRVVAGAVNRGKTEAVRRALNEVTGDVVLIQDADHEYFPEDLPSLVEPFLDRTVQAVYGSRFLARRWPEGMRLDHWLANKLFTFVTNRLYGGQLTDEGTALKAVRRELMESLHLRSQRFAFCPEVTARLLRRKVPIVEVPVRYRARSRGEGKKPGLLDGLEILWTLIRLRFVGEEPAEP